MKGVDRMAVSGSFFPSLGKWFPAESAMTIVSSLMDGCGLSHERVEELTISPVLSGFQPPNSTQVLLQPFNARID